MAGVGNSDTDHLLNVTGSCGSDDVKKMLPIIRQLVPNARRMGTLYTPNAVNSVYCSDLLVEETKGSEYELLSLGVASASETPDATQSLCDQQVDFLPPGFKSDILRVIQPLHKQLPVPEFLYLD